MFVKYKSHQKKHKTFFIYKQTVLESLYYVVFYNTRFLRKVAWAVTTPGSSLHQPVALLG